MAAWPFLLGGSVFGIGLSADKLTKLSLPRRPKRDDSRFDLKLMCGLAARHRAVRVGITCRYLHQAELAERFGLEPLAPSSVDAWAGEHRPGVVIETVGGDADTIAEAVQYARRGGRIVVVGVFGAPRPTDYVQVVMKELEIVGSMIYGTVGSGSEFGAAVHSMTSVASELAALQTHHFKLNRLTEAFRTAEDKSSLSVKVTIR